VSVRDIFGTGRWQGSSYGQGFKSNFRFQREPRVVMLTLSYKINNFKMDKTPSDDQASPSMEDNGYQP
jgi:hypothetical protein